MSGILIPGKTGLNLRDAYVRRDEITLGNKLMGKESQEIWEATKFRE